jgi:prepilin-type N-terminal cleavage/methylation domain-containing protein
VLNRGSSPRLGVTLIELIVAMIVGGVVLALVAVVSVRQQRIYADVADRSALAGQLRQAAAILPIELRGVASGAGDIREARDTAFEMRSTIATAVVCDTLGGALVLAPAGAGAATYASFLTAIGAGDTAWTLSASDTADQWDAHAVQSVANTGGSQCAALGPQLSAGDRTTSRIAIHLTGLSSLAELTGTVVRVTRPVRYSLYRGGDGRWYLGQRDWNVASMRFNTIQPVAGPFASPSLRGLVFQYSDSSDAPLPSPVADPRAIALVRVDVRGQSRNAMRAFGAGVSSRSTDSVQLAVALRNRR